MTRIDPVALLIDLVRVPSPSGQEAELVDAVHAWARAASLPAERLGRNLVIRVGRGKGGRLLYNSHLDTVVPTPTWETDPFSPAVTGERIVGLGANDAKGCVAAMLCAVAEASASGRIPGELVLALTVDEELDVGRSGGLESILDRLGPLDAAVIGEPTGLDICRAQKGRLLLEATTAGVARHSAHAEQVDGDNAVVEAARAICALERWDPGDGDRFLGRTTCQVTTIRGGEKSNIVPDRCVFCLDLRTADQRSPAELVASLEQVTGAAIRVLGDPLMPFETDEQARIVQAARTARPKARVIASSTMSDGVWTAHLPTIKIGPGQTERSHTAGEYVTVQEIQDGVLFYEKLLYAYFA